MALQMIEDAEADGRLKPGGTIIEGTSGNTGMGLALAAIVKGYKCIFVMADKQSKEKVDILRAVGAEVVVCPTAVEPDDPRSYYSVSKRLGEETPNAWYVNQYDNPSNCKAHFKSTGPEIWEQTNDKDAAVYTQRLAKEEGMFLGNSAGAAIKGVLQLKEHFTKDDVVVVLFHDHGSRYV
eukprot:maker-scaffold1883_size25724-snap-gene-0.0 protein:Tk12528 transcript:maker-scaffold1883_size25724-snap-gene-0.0-mRNA-1 annotation:"cysteine synthase"